MRKITLESIEAFENGDNFSQSNTTVAVIGNSSKLFLHGNLIAVKNLNTGKTSITNCGHCTNVTKERLNGIKGVSIYQKNWIWFLNGSKWSGNWIEIN